MRKVRNYDPCRDGNRLFKENVVIASLSEVYTYDDLNQLASYKLGTLNSGRTDVTGTPTNSQSWDFDAVGNWDSVTTNSTTQTRGANRQNEITSVSGATTPTYDNNGNLTKDENDYRFVWDAWNMMVQVKNSSNVVIVTMGRDALHRHVTDTVGTSVTDRLFSEATQLLETKAGSNTVSRNVWSPAYLDAMVLRDRDTDSNGTLDERIYPLQDANWNTTGLMNASGTVVERETYGPYGGVTFRDAYGSVISTSARDWVFLHQGGEKIAAGDYEFRNRVVSPTLGRWLSNDPLGFDAGDVNTYRYVGNAPVNGVDPSGLQATQLQEPIPLGPGYFYQNPTPSHNTPNHPPNGVVFIPISRIYYPFWPSIPNSPGKSPNTGGSNSGVAPPGKMNPKEPEKQNPGTGQPVQTVPPNSNSQPPLFIIRPIPARDPRVTPVGGVDGPVLGWELVFPIPLIKRPRPAK